MWPTRTPLDEAVLLAGCAGLDTSASHDAWGLASAEASAAAIGCWDNRIDQLCTALWRQPCRWKGSLCAIASAACLEAARNTSRPLTRPP